MDTNFTPVPGLTILISVGASTTTTALPGGGQANAQSFRFANNGAAVVSLEFGGAGVVANAGTSLFILGNSVEVFELPPGTTHVATLGSAGGNSLGVTKGQGR